MAIARDDRIAAGSWPVAASVVALSVLLFLDLVIGQTYFGVNAPALAAGCAIGVAVLLAPRYLFAATLLAAGASLAITYVVARTERSAFGYDIGRAFPGLAEAGGLLLLLCLALRSLTPPGALLAAGAVCASFAAIVEIRRDTGYAPLMTAVYGIAIAVAGGAGLYLRSLDTDRIRAVDRVRQDERLAIARELHDVVAHHVTGIVVQAQAAQAVWAEQPEVAVQALSRIEAAGAEALGSMRRLVGTLRAGETGPLVPSATLDDLRTLATRSAAMGLPVRLHLDGIDELPTAVAPSIHRVVGEAITNAQRHATGATGVDVHLRASGGQLTLEVVDDGHGVRGARPGGPGYGLTGMAERTEALGGRFEAGPVPGGGWRIRALLPLGGAA